MIKQKVIPPKLLEESEDFYPESSPKKKSKINNLDKYSMRPKPEMINSTNKPAISQSTNLWLISSRQYAMSNTHKGNFSCKHDSETRNYEETTCESTPKDNLTGFFNEQQCDDFDPRCSLN